MSRAYRIAVTETLRRHVVVGDHVKSKLGLLDVLPPEEMAELLERRLLEAGFEKGEDGKMTRETDGVVVEIDLLEQTVAVRVEGEVNLDLTLEGVGRSVQKTDEKLEDQLRKQTKARLEEAAKKEAETARGKLTDRLEAALADIRPELDQLTNKVLGDALKQRAGQLGEIQEISEEENGSMTIRVKV